MTVLGLLGVNLALGTVSQTLGAEAPPPPVYVAPTPVSPPTPPPDSQKVWTAPTPSETQTNPPSAATPAPAATARRRTAAEIEKLIAPIALYPDPLLASILPASVYPLEVVQAARFVKNTNNLAKLDQQPWDENVKVVARFPEVIDRMSEELSWTVELGQAFVAQQMDVMDSVQTLRNKARGTGALRDTPEQTVTVTNMVVQQVAVPEPIYVTNTVVEIHSAQPGVVYVPQYNPAIVYTPAYYYDPWIPLVTFGFGIACGPWFWSGCYWGGGYVVYSSHGCYPSHYSHGGTHPPPPPSGSGPSPGTRQASRAAAGESASGVAQSASTRPWQPDANRLQKSYGSTRSTASRTATTAAPGRIASSPGVSTATRAVPSSATPVARATPATTPPARSGQPAGYSRTDVPGTRSTPSVAAPGAVQRVTPAPSTVNRSAPRSMVPRSAVPGTVSGWQGTGTGASRSWAAPSSSGFYSAPRSMSGSMPSRVAPSAPSSFSRGGGMSSGGVYRGPSAPSSVGRSGGGSRGGR